MGCERLRPLHYSGWGDVEGVGEVHPYCLGGPGCTVVAQAFTEKQLSRLPLHLELTVSSLTPGLPLAPDVPFSASLTRDLLLAPAAPLSPSLHGLLAMTHQSPRMRLKRANSAERISDVLGVNGGLVHGGAQFVGFGPSHYDDGCRSVEHQLGKEKIDEFGDFLLPILLDLGFLKWPKPNPLQSEPNRNRAQAQAGLFFKRVAQARLYVHGFGQTGQGLESIIRSMSNQHETPSLSSLIPVGQDCNRDVLV
ncbi:hypothetical protein Scep_021957 [Stephania cephalantha]|uniref:Uncharacterized protein n=1 Tax=Stephania cephalantha TaxID=152367 RepID=A0AAP0FD02_9MAGN